MFTSIQSDGGVIRKVLRGQTDAFRVLVERYGNVVYGVAYARIGNAADAEEIAQVAFVRLYQWLDRVAGRRTVGPWLVEVARNAATDLLRRREREVPLDNLSGEAGAVRAHDHARDEVCRVVWEQLGALDNLHREVLILHYFEGKKTGEIARLLQISPAAARKRLERSRYELGRRVAAMVGEKTSVRGKESARVHKVMAAIGVARAAWQPSAALSVSGAAIVGVSTAKVVTGVAAVALIVGLGLLAGWRHMNRPYDTQNITTKSEFVTRPEPAGAEATASPVAAEKEEAVLDSAAGQGASPAPKPTATFRGLVLDGALKPVAGATVKIDNQQAFRNFQDVLRTRGTLYSIEPVEVSQSTTADGTFCFEQVPVAADFLFCQVRISAQKDYAYAEVVASFVGGAGDAYCELVLEPAAVVEGRVVDPSGAGLGDAKVMVCNESVGSYLPRPFEIEANGTFLTGPLTPGYYNIIARCPGFSQKSEMSCLMPGRQRLTIQMTSGGCSISGRLTSRPDGRPVAGVSMASWCRNRPSYSGTTDGAGRFDIFGIEPDTYRLRLSERAPWVIAESPEVVVPEGEAVTGVEVQAVRGAYVSGRVLDEKTGEPMPRLPLRFDPPEGDAYGTGTYPDAFTDEQGAYSIGPLTPGRYQVLLWGDFITETSYTLPSFADVAGVDFKVAHDAAVTGTVVDSEGRPVAGASVVAASVETQHFATTDSEGRFSIRLAKRHLPTRLQAYSSGRASEEVGPVRGDSDHRLTLLPASRIEGTVVDQSGRPQPDMWVQVEINGPLWYPGNGIDGSAATTSATGLFRIEFVLPGEHTLNVYAGSSPVGYPVATADVTVREGETLHARLVINTQGLGQVEGFVLSNGAPMPGVGVEANCDGEEWVGSAHDLTDVDGFYRITKLRPGGLTVSLRVSTADGGRTQRAEEIDLAAGETHRVDFDLGETNYGIEGYVTQSGIDFYPEVIVYPTGSTDDAEKMTFECGAGGYYRAGQLREGMYDVEVHDLFNPKIIHAVRREVQTHAGEMVRCDFEILAGAIEGTVGRLRQNEVAHVAVFPDTTDFSLISAALGSDIIAETVVKPGQEFRFNGLPPGVYYLGAVAVPAGSESDSSAVLTAVSKGRAVVQPVEVAPAQTAIVDLPLP